jgi:hypothetical protein
MILNLNHFRDVLAIYALVKDGKEKVQMERIEIVVKFLFGSFRPRLMKRHFNDPNYLIRTTCSFSGKIIFNFSLAIGSMRRGDFNVATSTLSCRFSSMRASLTATSSAI